MGRRLKFLFFYFFLLIDLLIGFFFCTVFTIIIIKCKALFSCHSSSYHYSTQGFVLISFHFFFFLIKNKQIKYYAISHLTFCCVYGYQT